MKWFIVLLFWNPSIGDYQVNEGWSPIPLTSEAQCWKRAEYVEQYLPGAPGGLHIVDCIEAWNPSDAILIAKAGIS